MRSTRPQRLTLKAQGNTLIYRERESEEGMHNCMHNSEQPCAQSTMSSAHVSTEKDKHRSRLMHRLRHTQTNWHSIKNGVSHGPTWICWFSRCSTLLSHQKSYFSLRREPCTKSIFSLLCSYLIHLSQYN